MRRIDLHVHTTVSDSTCSPAEVVRLAAQAGLAAIAITDHDSIDGYLCAAAEAEKTGLELVPAIEISTKYGVAVHILGYYIDPESVSLKAALKRIVDDRDDRNRRLVELMAADGLPISYEMMHERFGDVIGRPNFGQMLVEFGLAESVQDAFDRFIEKGQRYYLPRTVIPIETTIEMIRSAGGIPVLAHPFQYRKNDTELRELIEHCVPYGLMGIECRYSFYGEDKVKYLENLAGEYSLVKTGGSDFHGTNKPKVKLGIGDGGLPVPYEYLEQLKELKSRL